MLIVTVLFFFQFVISEHTATVNYKSNHLLIKEVSEGTYIHTSYLNTTDFGKVSCNGMVVIDDGKAAVFDTPVNDSASVELLNWIKEKGASVKLIVPTHFHNDCVGGISAFHDHQIKSMSSSLTSAFLLDQGPIRMKATFPAERIIHVGQKLVEVKYFGPGHTYDNVVVYVRNNNVLFGGCLIKSKGAGKGFLGDADISEWSNTVVKVKNYFSDVEHVIPGHGEYGGPELLSYTIDLFLD